MDLYGETISIMKRYGISAKKNLGQNFLIDINVVTGIIEAADITKEDMVIEIGPGLGTLTKCLLEKAGKVICIELDPKMVDILENRFKEISNFQIIHDDVLKVDLREIIKENRKTYNKVKVVANLPYYITTPIIMKLLEDKLDIDTITIMIQKEVADRLVTKPGSGDTGAITYSIHYYSEPQVVLQVPKECFIPQPQVNSSVIQLRIRKKNDLNIKDEELFFRIIKIAFMQKRKTILNSLTNGLNNVSKEEITKMLGQSGVDLSIRAEKITIEQFANMANYLTNLGF